VEHWSLTILREKLVKIGAKVVRRGCYVTFQLAEVAVSKSLFQKTLALIDDLRRSPVPAYAEEIDGKVEKTGEVCLDDDKIGQMGSNNGQIIKSGRSDGSRAEFLPSVLGVA